MIRYLEAMVAYGKQKYSISVAYVKSNWFQCKGNFYDDESIYFTSLNRLN